MIKTTQEEFEKKVKDKFNGEYVVIGKYINNRCKIELSHKKCGTKFIRTAKDFLARKVGCPNCAKIKLQTMHLKSHAQFLEEFKSREEDFELLSEYKGQKEKIKVRHKKCDKVFLVNSNNFINKKSGCPHCAKNNKKNHIIFSEEIEALENGEYSLIGEYKNSKIPTEIKHNKCGNIFLMSRAKFISGQRCAICKESKGETKIRKFLTANNIKFERQVRFKDCRGAKYPLAFDFAIKHNDKIICLIEFDGEQHFHPVNFYGIDMEKAKKNHLLTKNNDRIKDIYCKNNNIKLIRIPYFEIDNIEEILSKMGIPNQAVQETVGRRRD